MNLRGTVGHTQEYRQWCVLAPQPKLPGIYYGLYTYSCLDIFKTPPVGIDSLYVL